MSKEKAVLTALPAEPQRGEDESQTSLPMSIVSAPSADVKLLSGFQKRNIPNIDIVDTMRTAFPGFDNPLLSKCRNPKQYGVGLRREAVRLLAEHFKIRLPEAPQTPRRRKPYRIQCRVTETAYRALQLALARSGQTTQDWLEALILKELKGAVE